MGVRKGSVIFDQTLSITIKLHATLTLTLTSIVLNLANHTNPNQYGIQALYSY